MICHVRTWAVSRGRNTLSVSGGTGAVAERVFVLSMTSGQVSS